MAATSEVEGSRPRRRKTGGRAKGTPNKLTGQLKEMVLQALDEAHPDGSVAYLRQQANANPAAFMTLVGKVLPLQVTGAGGGPVETVTRIELVAPDGNG